MKEVLELLKQEHQEIKGVMHELSKKKMLKPEGTLRCEKKNRGFQYYHVNGIAGVPKSGQYIRQKDMDLARQLAEKEYIQKLQKSLSQMDYQLSHFIQIYEENRLEKVYENLCEARRRLITPIFKPENEFIKEWESEIFTPKPFAEEDKTEHYTNRGERVRSKSEKMIADEFLRLGVPYKYERPIILQSGNRNIKIHPDFTVLSRRTRKELYVEHLGMMDDIDYVTKNVRKLDLYEKNGILLGDQLLLFHETKDMPLNIRIVDQYIRKYLL